nr:MAG TPA: hypothetical protein [Caudoviricetes sp.]
MGARPKKSTIGNFMIGRKGRLNSDGLCLSKSIRQRLVPRFAVIVQANDLQRPRQYIRACSALKFRQVWAWLHQVGRRFNCRRQWRR